MTRLGRAQGIALVAFAAAIPVGEGLAMGLLALVTLIGGVRLVLEGAYAAKRWQMEPFIGFGIWVLAGIGAWLWGGYGVLDAGEFSRWLPILALGLVPWFIVNVEAKYREQAAVAFLVVLILAAVFSLLTVGLNARPGEWLVRGASGGVVQGRMPFDSSRTVAGGFYFHRLKFAHVASLGFVLLAVRLLVAKLSLRRRVFEGVAVAILGTALMFTFARAALLGVAAGVAIVALLTPGRRRLLCLGLAAAGLAIAMLSEPVRERIASIVAAQASSERAILWSQALRVIADHPLGVGLGNYTQIVGAYYDTVEASFSTRTYAHSLWLSAWAESGPVGVLSIVGGLLAAPTRLKRRGSSWRFIAAAGVVACWLAIGLTHDLLYHQSVALAYAATLGWLIAVPGGEQR